MSPADREAQSASGGNPAGVSPRWEAGEARAEVDEQTFLARYRHERYARPSVTVDLVIFTVTERRLHVLLIRRKGHPFQGALALPGGFVDVGDAYEHQGESLEEAAHRELAEETGLPPGSCFLEQLHTFGDPGRDPRTRVISVAHFALVPSDRMALVQAGDDAADARWFPVPDLLPAPTDEGTPAPPLPLAFDHGRILEMAVERLRSRLDRSPIAFHLLPPSFTISELRAVHEAVKGDRHDAANFHRRFRRMLEDGLLRPCPERRATPGRPARVYAFVR